MPLLYAFVYALFHRVIFSIGELIDARSDGNNQ